jgi:hypothetical protein
MAHRIDMGPALKLRLVILAAFQQAIQSEAQDQNYQPTEIIIGVIHGRSAYLKSGYSGDSIVDPTGEVAPFVWTDFLDS